MTLLLAVAASCLLIAPVSNHRLLFRQHRKRELVDSSNRMALGGLGFLSLAIIGAMLFVTDVLFNTRAAGITAGCAAALYGWFWYALPLIKRSR